MKPSDVLDVTVLEPRLRHPAIFGRFDALPEGGSLVIVNDHDPKPLYYQLRAERGRSFEWTYLEQGPSTWRVRITRVADGTPSETVGELLSQDHRRAEVFRKHGIDFCCGGRRSLRDACVQAGADEDAVLNDLAQLNRSRKGDTMRFTDWTADLLCDYFVQNHHAYIRQAVERLTPLLQKLAAVHGERHPETAAIRDVFQRVAGALSVHLAEEERTLFPYARALAEAQRHGGSAEIRPTTRAGLDAHRADHEQAGRWMKEMERLSNRFQVPADGCATYQLVYEGLKEFWDDLQIHIHLENDVLFPKVLALETALRR